MELKEDIDKWIQAYPEDLFPAPDLELASRVLKENGLTLDAVGAHIIRNTLLRVKVMIEENESFLTP